MGDPRGVLGAIAAGLLLRLIGLITNMVFADRIPTTVVNPGTVGAPWWVILGAPVVGGLVVGLMARYGSEKIRGHGMPEAIEGVRQSVSGANRARASAGGTT